MRSVGASPAVLMGLFLSTWSIGTAAALAEGQSTSAPAGFVKLYNGNDLTGWEAQHGKLSSWKASGELLQCVAAGGGWLRTADNLFLWIMVVDRLITTTRSTASSR